MNLAVSSIILLILLLPGIAFRMSLIKSDSFENTLDTSRVAELLFVLLPSLALHGVALWIFHEIFGSDSVVNLIFDHLLGLSSSSDVRGGGTMSSVPSSFVLFLGYSVVMTVTGGAIGWLCKRVILARFLDLRRPSIFGITNEWDNLFSGRRFLFEKQVELKLNYLAQRRQLSEQNASSAELRALRREYTQQKQAIHIEFINLDLMVQTGGQTYLYQGTLLDYYLAKENEIDKLLIINPQRKAIHEGTESKFHQIASDVIVLQREHIVNLNFRVTWAEPKSEP